MAITVGGCCGCVLAVLVALVAIVLSVLAETPDVLVLGKPGEAADVLSAAPGVNSGSGAESTPAADSAASRSGGPDGVVGVVPGDGLPAMGSGRMFDRIASVYDATNKVLSFGLDQRWRSALVEDCLSLQKGDRVLDLATGTADVSLLAGRRLSQLAAGEAAHDSVMGVDPSTEMLRIGVSKVEEQGLKGVVRLVKGDAQNLTSVQGIDKAGAVSAPTAGIETGSIDKISMAFGIRNVPNRGLALQEMRRVLRNKPSSRVCILELSLPTGEKFLSRVAHAFITRVVPLIGKVTTLGGGSAEYKYLEESILKFPKPLDFAAQMQSEGLPVHSITSFGYGAVHIYAAAPAQR